MQKKRILLYLFLLCCLVNLYAEWSQQQTLIYLSKPLLITLLSLYFFFASQSHPSTFRNFILLGFLFSIGGDTFLMFVENNAEAQSFFIYGLASFLITHLCYLYAFIKWPSSKIGWLRQHPLLVIPFLIFFIAYGSFLWPDLPTAMRIPVLVYMAAILAMTASCLHLYSRIPSTAFKLLMTGILLFVFSDNIIALNKFKSHQLFIPQARLVIMISYLAGQFWIARGAIALLESTVGGED